ncbi:peptidoglycan/LPS O-acetylase OafA/YrhL [Granulicella aggregans]|uniref:Peptidoglycan/LPS O-acetylase OafA/YrhL n=1 Tax=Granulicella aggregans TaxID=474949 RepID=A0A7W8E2H0_9BACT|nr:acyltransferase [Granulicella aggregans]MBB5056179.1 peptidoglycan/LPS O-acetylase OafA/YrhL [Granulicella aggregans]
MALASGTSSIDQTDTNSFKDTSASVLFDLIRGLAALIVLFGHWRNLVFVDYPSVATHRLILALPYALTSAGHQAVVIFFVLSGYLISGSVFRSFTRNRWTWIDYLTHRLVRLWVVLIPGLLLCLLWDSAGLALHLAPALYSGHLREGFIGNIPARLTPRVFFGNLFFLQNLLVPVFGSDGPLWSLANEFWYYLLFPLGLVALRSQTPTFQRLACGVLFLATAWFLRHDILLLFPIWLAGTVLALVPPQRLRPRTRVIAAVIYAPLPFVFAKLHGLPAMLSDYLFGVATSLFLWIVLSATGPADPKLLFTRFSRSIAKFSYTLYVVHLPFALFLTTLIMGERRWTPDAAHVVMGLAIAAAVLVYAWLIALTTEFHTDRVRHWIEARVRR